ncbi:replication initiator protein A [Bilifractor sp. LCP21S3_A7]|uniref:replication initiator protein A n=1 Tax=Bilifractor sp. LCP21S3_A7 TaxID=3438738 RepID=UPI003F9243C2
MAPKLERFHDYRKGIRYNFIPIPMILIYDDAYRSMSAYAKILYSLILNRMHLSERNHWEDEQGVYIKYSTTEICEDLQCSDRSALKYRKELVDYGLIEVQVMGQGKESKIYPFDFAEPLPEQEETVPEKKDEDIPVSNADMDHGNEKAEENPNVSQKENFDNIGKKLVDFNQVTEYTENIDRTKMACLERKNLPIKNGKNLRSRTEKSSDLERKNFPAEKEYIEKDINIYNPSIHQETQNRSSSEQKEKQMDGWMDGQKTDVRTADQGKAVDCCHEAAY